MDDFLPRSSRAAPLPRTCPPLRASPCPRHHPGISTFGKLHRILTVTLTRHDPEEPPAGERRGAGDRDQSRVLLCAATTDSAVMPSSTVHRPGRHAAAPTPRPAAAILLGLVAGSHRLCPRLHRRRARGRRLAPGVPILAEVPAHGHWWRRLTVRPAPRPPLAPSPYATRAAVMAPAGWFPDGGPWYNASRLLTGRLSCSFVTICDLCGAPGLSPWRW